jgi:hypothetical protein
MPTAPGNRLERALGLPLVIADAPLETFGVSAMREDESSDVVGGGSDRKRSVDELSPHPASVGQPPLLSASAE